MNFKDDRQGRLVKTVKNGKFDILVTVDQNGKYGYILRRGYSNVSHGANFANEEGAIYAATSSIKSFGNLYDSACSYMDSVIGNIARKIEDEFNEKDHPRDKGGKFTSKGGEGKGGKKEILPETETEKAAKEELKGSTKSDEETLEGLDDYGQNLLDYCTDIDTANDALRALNWDTSDYEDLEQARTALKEAISQNPKAAKELWESTSNKEEIEEVRAGRETDEIVEEFKGSGIDMYAALSDLGINVQRIPEAYHEDVFKEKLFNSPKFRKKAKEYINQYRNSDTDEEWFGNEEAPKKETESSNKSDKYEFDLTEEESENIKENLPELVNTAEESILSGDEEQYIKKSDEFFKAIGKSYKKFDGYSDWDSRRISLRSAVKSNPEKAYKVLVGLGHIWRP